MDELLYHALVAEPGVPPMLAGRKKSSGDAEWDDPDALAEEEFDEIDEIDDDEIDDDLAEEDEIDADEDLEEFVDDDDTASLDELGEEEGEYEDEREDWDT